MTPRKILVPIDFSQTSVGALDYARTLAAGFRARVHVLHVIEAPTAHDWGVDTAALPYTYARLENETRGRLEAFLAGAAADGFEAEIDVEAGDPQAEIVRCADAHHIDLIVMGSRGLGALGQMLMGSVAEWVARHARCPVLIVRTPGHQVARVAETAGELAPLPEEPVARRPAEAAGSAREPLRT